MSAGGPISSHGRRHLIEKVNLCGGEDIGSNILLPFPFQRR